MKATKSMFTLLIHVTVVRVLQLGKSHGCNSEYLGSHMPLPDRRFQDDLG